MGFKRVIGSGCLGMLCLIPMAFVSFRFLNLTEGITGGLISNIDDAIANLTSALGGVGVIIQLLAGMLIGAILIFLFPIHWCLFYRPDDVLLVIAVTIPWILCCVITSGLFAHSPRGGLNTSLAIGIGYMIPVTLVYVILAIVTPFGIGTAILDGLLIGLTDLPYLVAVLTAILEGTLVGAVFGAFIGSLKYKSTGTKKKKKKKKVKVEGKDEPMETGEMFPREVVEEVGTPTSDYCKNCGARLTAEDLFCTNCGAKK